MSLGHTHTNIKHAEYGALPHLEAKVGRACQKVGGAMQNVGGAQQDAHSLVGGQAALSKFLKCEGGAEADGAILPYVAYSSFQL